MNEQETMALRLGMFPEATLVLDVFHNVSEDRMRFFTGYTEGDPITLVAKFVATTTNIMEALEQAFRSYNIGEDVQAEAYRANKNRSLSVGDVAIVDGVAYACDKIGWTQVKVDPSQVVTVTTHGTTPLTVNA